jgi:hypothetical protein
MKNIITILISIIIILSLVSCKEKCSPKEVRCDGNTQQVCDNDGEWEDLLDCSISKSKLIEDSGLDASIDAGADASIDASIETKSEYVCCDKTPLFDGKAGCDLSENCE